MVEIVLEVPCERLARWRAVAKAEGLTVEDWLVAAADDAAAAAHCAWSECGRLLPKPKPTGRPRQYCGGRRGNRCRKAAMVERRATGR
jgi:hypothetical protein